MIRNNLLKQVTIPYKYVKGSEFQRYQRACQFTNKIVSNISGTLQSEGVSLSKFSRNLHKLLPKNLKLSVKKHNLPESIASLNRIFADNNYLVRHSFELSPNKKGRIDILNLPTIAHEIQHLGDSLFQPKIMARDQILAKKDLDSDKFCKFFENEVYVPEAYRGKRDKRFIIRIIEHKTKKILKGLPTSDKVDLLQYMRYNLMSEKNAFNASRKCAKNLFKKNIPVYEDELSDFNKDYLFDEKISLFKNMAYKLIKKEREIFAINLKKVKCNDIKTNLE